MHPQFKRGLKAAVVGLAMVAASAQAQVARISEDDFLAGSGVITFSEFAVGSINPTYTPDAYGGTSGMPTVTFDGFFTGQSLGSSCGGAASGCVIGSPTGGTLTLAGSSPNTSIRNDGDNPTSPVLSGSPLFNGPISILFSHDVAGVGLEGGYFNAIGATAITAFARDGSVLGQVTNTVAGIEFLGLVTADGLDRIAGLQFSLVGAEPFGFAIDNLRFGATGSVNVPGGPTAPVPEPETYALMLAGLGAVALIGRRRRRN